MRGQVIEAPQNWTDEAVGGQRPPSALWSWDYLRKCFADDKVCVSFGLWALASLLWITSHALLFYVRYKRKSRHEERVICNIYSFFGSLCNTIGALLSKQLTIQIFTGGYMAAIDVINFVLTLFPVCGIKFRRRSGRHHSRRKRKYRTSLFALFLSFSAGTGGYIMAAGALSSLEDYHGPKRKLLATLLQENTEIIGFTLGMVAVLISWTSRIPVIAKVCKGQVFSAMQLWATFFSVLASLLYAAAIMAHDRQPAYFARATPWFLISLGSAALDVATISLSCLMKSKFSRKMGLVVETFDAPDLQVLLAREEEEAEEENELEDKRQGNEEKTVNWTPLNMFPSTRSHQQVSEIGRYMDLSIEPVQQGGFGAIRVPGDGETSARNIFLKEPPSVRDLPARHPMQVIHDSLSSSSSSYTSSMKSELEGGFGAIRVSGDGETSARNIFLKEPPSVRDLPAHHPMQVIHDSLSSSSSSYTSSMKSELEWDFEDLNNQWNGDDVDVSNIQPHDSSVLNARSREDSDAAPQLPPNS